MKTRWFIISSFILTLSMLLSACTGGAATTPTTAAVEQPTSPPAAQPTTPPAAQPTTPPAAGATVPATPATAAGGCPLKVESGAKITFSGWGDPTEQKIYRDSIDRFTAVCPGVSVDYVPIPDKFQDKMKAQMAGGTAP
ncbi:MAG TPA: hypothetical protein VGK00_15705, partial [Anaerolineales bacterium]